MSEYGNAIIKHEEALSKNPVVNLSDLITKNFRKKGGKAPEIKSILTAAKERLHAAVDQKRYIAPTQNSAEQNR